MGGSEKIIEREMHGAGEAIQKEETYNKYGGAARRIEIEAIGEHGTFVRTLATEIPEGEVVIDGRFVYTTKHRPVKSGYAKNRCIRG